MKDSIHANANITSEIEKRADRFRQRTGVIDSIGETGQVRVRFDNDTHVRAAVQHDVTGDDVILSVGDLVQVADRAGEVPIVVGVSRASGSEKRVTDEGARVLGHPTSDSKIHYDPDGTISIVTSPDGSDDTMEWSFNADGSVDVSVPPSGSPVLSIDENGLHFANEQVMTDIDVSKDGGGDVSDVTPVYTDTISL